MFGFFSIGNASYSEIYLKKKIKINLYFGEKSPNETLVSLPASLVVFFTDSAVISTVLKCPILIWKKPFCFYYCGSFHCTSVNITLNSFSQCNDLTSKEKRVAL